MKLFNTLIYLLFIIYASISVAQEDADTNLSTKLETIVVTATKTEHTLEDFPRQQLLLPVMK